MSLHHIGDQIAQLRIALGNSELAILNHLIQMEKRIMSKISDFAAAQTAFNTQIDTALTDIKTEIDTLNTQIAALQNSAGQISPEDQATLDALQKTAATLAAKAQAMDSLTPPTPPTSA